MSHAQFVESFSADPNERAIAERVAATLGNAGMARNQKIALIRQAQQELLAYRSSLPDYHNRLQELLARTGAVCGSTPASVQVVHGRVLAGVVQKNNAFTWVDIGPVPENMPDDLPPVPLRHARKKSRKQNTINPIAARRKELKMERGAAPSS